MSGTTRRTFGIWIVPLDRLQEEHWERAGPAFSFPGSSLGTHSPWLSLPSRIERQARSGVFRRLLFLASYGRPDRSPTYGFPGRAREPDCRPVVRSGDLKRLYHFAFRQLTPVTSRRGPRVPRDRARFANHLSESALV
jgi:hypothetical protein